MGNGRKGAAKKQPKAGARARATGGLESKFSPEFQDLIDMCKKEIRRPTKGSGAKSNWARILLDTIKAAKEELRLSAGPGDVAPVLGGPEPPDKPRPTP